jgi:thioredoxin reductase (NADPH)
MERWDCIIVGSGPAGLTAAMYMARFRRAVLVLHDGKARALRIPKTHNAPGFPDGISGVDLIARMTRHAVKFGAKISEAEVISTQRNADVFELVAKDGGTWITRSLILATGIVLNEIEMDHDEHEAAIAAGILRYCPICDGFEHIDEAIGVVGCDSQGAAEALFLRQYSANITLVPNNFAELDPPELKAMRDAGINVKEPPLDRLQPLDDRINLYLCGDDAPLSFDVIYPALGVRPRSELARSLGLDILETGEVAVEAPFGTPVDGLYAAGDVVKGLDQISVAMGHGAIAATKAHNWLRERDGHVLSVGESPDR